MSPRKDFELVVRDWDTVNAIIGNIDEKIASIKHFQHKRHLLVYEVVGFGSNLIPLTEGTPEYVEKIRLFEKMYDKIEEYDQRILVGRDDLGRIVNQYETVCRTLMDRIGGIVNQMNQRAGDLAAERKRLQKQIKTMKSAFGNPDGHVAIITEVKRQASAQLNEPESEEVEKLAKSYINLTEKKKSGMDAPDTKRLKKLELDLKVVELKLRAKLLKYIGIRDRIVPLYNNIKASISIQKSFTAALRAVN